VPGATAPARRARHPTARRPRGEPRQRQPPPLSGGQMPHGEAQQTRQAEPLGRRQRAGVVAAGPADLELELVARRAADLQSVLVADEVDVGAPRLVRLERAALAEEGDLARCGRDEAGDGAQEAGLAGAVGTGQRHGLPGAQRQVEGPPRVYEAGGRKPGVTFGIARREAERCVSRPSARPRNRYSGGFEQGRTLTWRLSTA